MAGFLHLQLTFEQTCRKATEHIMDLLLTWKNLYTLRYVPGTMIQVLFSAATIHLILCIHAASGGQRMAEKTLTTHLAQGELCICYLEEVGRYNMCAGNAAGVLKKLLIRHLRPMVLSRATPERILPKDSMLLEASDASVENEPSTVEEAPPDDAALPTSTPPISSLTDTQADTLTFSMYGPPYENGVQEPGALNDFNMDFFSAPEVSGFLAMLGGEPIAGIPFTPSYGVDTAPSSSAEFTSENTLDTDYSLFLNEEFPA